MEIIAAIVTLLIGIGTSVIFGNWINWWSAGAVFAVATMGRELVFMSYWLLFLITFCWSDELQTG